MYTCIYMYIYMYIYIYLKSIEDLSIRIYIYVYIQNKEEATKCFYYKYISTRRHIQWIHHVAGFEEYVAVSCSGLQ